MHERNCFITLTYDEAHLPPDTFEGTHGLDLADWQNFAKRLRKNYGKFRFLHCGEYGEKNKRPHYHACVFGIDFHEDRKFHRTSQSGDKQYTSEILNKAWKKGFTEIGTLNFDSAAYCAGYILKKITGKQQFETYGRIKDGRINKTTGECPASGSMDSTVIRPPYTTMSRNPGIGATWIDKYYCDVYPHDEVIVNGHETRPPKYYDTYLEKRDPTLHARIKSRRRVTGLQHEDNNTYWRLEVREKVKKSKENLYKKRDL